MILLLKSCLIPWTLSFSMFCITGLGVNFADIDLNQDSKDTLIVRNLRTENLITAIATQGNSNPEALKIANEWVSPISVNAADIAFLQSQNLRTDNVNTVIGTHCCNPKPLEIGNEWVSPKNDDTDRLSEDNFTSYRLSLSINPSPVEISPSLPKPSGNYSVGTTSYDFTDPEREEIYTEDPDDKRELMVRVWYPSEKVLGGKRAPYFSESSPGENPLGAIAIATNSIINAPVAQTESGYPVLLFSHGFASLPEFNTINAEELASQGYVVATINHTYESSVSVFPDGRVVTTSQFFNPVIEEQLESLNKNLNQNSNENLHNSEPLISSKAEEMLKQSVGVRAKDAQFVLDKLAEINGKDPSGLLTGKLDLDRVGMFGHSLGGATTAQTLLQDNRFKAGIDLDGGLFINGVDESLSQPFMFMNSEVMGTGNISEAQVPETQVQDFIKLRKSFFQNLQSDGYDVTIRGTGHYYFSDIPVAVTQLKDAGLPLGELGQLEDLIDIGNPHPINPERATQIINDYIVVFFNRYLKNQESPLFTASSPYPEVTALRASQKS